MKRPSSMYAPRTEAHDRDSSPSVDMSFSIASIIQNGFEVSDVLLDLFHDNSRGLVEPFDELPDRLGHCLKFTMDRINGGCWLLGPE